ncbi:hypothetical protein, partial [Desulfobotulus sp.]|uniref:hypothetical protein n=1 Tax=Desulfobotulus sp. TaxID=1940337 RepID=UPI002A36C945
IQKIRLCSIQAQSSHVAGGVYGNDFHKKYRKFITKNKTTFQVVMDNTFPQKPSQKKETPP